MGEAHPVPRPRSTLGPVGAWRSLVARGLWVAEVPGSNPGAPMFREIYGKAEPPMASSELMATLRRDPDRIFDLSPWEYGEVIGEILASFGWELSGTDHRSDQGVDMLGISRDPAGTGTTWAIEFKLYSPDRRVGADVGHDCASHSVGG
jgi:hypothetical protein